MKGLGLVMTIGGWAVAVGGLVASDAMALRLAMAAVGLGLSLAGIFAINTTHLEHAIWKAKGS